MNVSQKCQYALRAIFELAKSRRAQPTPAPEIAGAQAIPAKFLELILAELKHGGFVESRRGMRGGYLLLGRPDRVTVGDVIRFVDGPVGPVRCVSGAEEADCPLYGDCAFMGMWSRARDALNQVFDGTTFQDLIDEGLSPGGQYVADYCI
jgi:Rrf2 family cysteine metabolism transcriptional repressor